MPGIADSNVQAIQPANTAALAANVTPAVSNVPTPGVGQFMDSFKDGFITVQDIKRRSKDIELEDEKRRQDIIDESTVRPKERAGKIAELDARAAVQPNLAETDVVGAELLLGKAKQALEDFKQGGDPKAFTEAWRKFFPGQPLPRKDGAIDYEGGAEDLEVEVDRRKQIDAGKAGVANITENKIKRINPDTKLEEEVVIRTNKATGEKLGETVLSSQRVSLNEQESNAMRFSSRMEFNQKIINDNENAGFDATAIGTTAAKFLPNRFQGQQLQTYIAAKNNWIAAILRKESGAAIAKKEYEDADKQYFPQDGDDKIVTDNKRDLRNMAERQMTESIGPSAPDRTGGIAGGQSGSAQEPVKVNSPAEAPATAEFIQAPDGRIFKNPKFVAPAQ